MIADPGDKSAALPIPSSQLRSVVALLWQARCYAEDVQAMLWDFAVEAEFFGDALKDVRWLVANQLCEAAQEISAAGAPHRLFRHVEGADFDQQTCFVLTDKGAGFAGEMFH